MNNPNEMVPIKGRSSDQFLRESVEQRIISSGDGMTVLEMHQADGSMKQKHCRGIRRARGLEKDHGRVKTVRNNNEKQFYSTLWNFFYKLYLPQKDGFNTNNY